MSFVSHVFRKKYLSWQFLSTTPGTTRDASVPLKINNNNIPPNRQGCRTGLWRQSALRHCLPPPTPNSLRLPRRLTMAPLANVTSDNQKRSPKTVVTFLSGATSGCISTLALQPLDVVKTRMQMSDAYNRSVHLQPALSLQPNASVLETFRGIIRQDRISGLWRGVSPSILRNTMGVGAYFMTLNAITARLSSPDGSLSHVATLASGASARSLVVVLLCPLSVIKTRMETVEYSRKYNGIAHAMRTIVRQEGIGGLFSGLFPAILRDAPFSAMYMLIYLRTKETLGRTVGLQENRSSIMRSVSTQSPTQNPSTNSTRLQKTDAPTPVRSTKGLTMAVNFASGAVGGGLATLLTQPQDVVKTRMQLCQRHADGTPSRYSNVWESTRRLFNEEGLYAFFRGSSPRFLKRILGSAITWMVFEEANGFYSTLLQKEEDSKTGR